MKKSHTVLALISLSFQTVFAQTKEIKGDTVYWFKSNRELHKTLNLKSLEKSTDEFNFRIRLYGQIIDIAKDSVSFYGKIINYIYHTKNAKRKKTDTIFNKITLSPEKAKSVYSIIFNSGILKLPSDKEIKNWQFGVDGITYLIEHADAKNYWFKSYWTPSAQDSIPEALSVLNLVKDLTDSLALKETYATFKNPLPKHGSYNSGGIFSSFYVSNTFEIGYSGATKMPYGFVTSYSASYIGKTKVNSAIALQYNFDNSNFYHLNFLLSKWNILYKGSQISDFVVYNYQNRKLNINRLNNKFQNHQLEYGLNLKSNFGLRTGIDYLINDDRKLGVYISASKYFADPNLSIMLNPSVFNGQINYKTQILKSIYINKRLTMHRITFGLTYEDFMKYKDVYMNLQISI